MLKSQQSHSGIRCPIGSILWCGYPVASAATALPRFRFGVFRASSRHFRVQACFKFNASALPCYSTTLSRFHTSMHPRFCVSVLPRLRASTLARFLVSGQLSASPCFHASAVSCFHACEHPNFHAFAFRNPLASTLPRQGVFISVFVLYQICKCPTQYLT